MGSSKSTKKKAKSKEKGHDTPTTHLFRKDLPRLHTFKNALEKEKGKKLTNEETMSILLDKVA